MHENCVMPTLLIMKGKRAVGRIRRPTLTVDKDTEFFGFVNEHVKCSLSVLISSKP